MTTEKIKLARKEISALCGGKQFEMSIPRRDSDSDAVLSDALTQAEKQFVDVVQPHIDDAVHYRNLAITLGAKPERMTNAYDRALCSSGTLDSEGHVSEALRDVSSAWARVDAAERVVAAARTVYPAFAHARTLDDMRNAAKDCRNAIGTYDEAADPIEAADPLIDPAFLRFVLAQLMRLGAADDVLVKLDRLIDRQEKAALEARRQ